MNCDYLSGLNINFFMPLVQTSGGEDPPVLHPDLLLWSLYNYVTQVDSP